MSLYIYPAHIILIAYMDMQTNNRVFNQAVFIVDDLPKTRSGKIMRRILRKILAGEEDQLGDISTLSDPSVVEHIIQTVIDQ